MSEIYEPAEDSYLMSETLKKEIPVLLRKNPNIKFLEIGCGSGINLQTAFICWVKKENIIGTDINEEAVNHCKALGFNCVKSNLFDNINGKYDIIIFNPPYLPLDKDEPKSSRMATTGGRKGNEIIIKFLKQAQRHLNKDGKIFLITSSLSEEVNFDKLDYKAVKINYKDLFFEKLHLWKLEVTE